MLDEYGGDAERIWNDDPTAEDLRRRLERFQGIGQKKAAMAVEILERQRGTVIRRLEGSDIAFDVHVRRVFLRTGIAERDDQQHMVEAARRLHPGPTWCARLPRVVDRPRVVSTDGACVSGDSPTRARQGHCS